MIRTLKVRNGVGGKAFPADFNWICPVCGNENRAFSFPQENGHYKDIVTRQELADACQYCLHKERYNGGV